MRRSTVLSTRRRGDDRFPETRWTRILQAQHVGTVHNRELLQELLQAYWKPVYATLRRFYGQSIEDAKDATQEFFTVMLERNFIRHVRRSGTFRGFLKVSLRNFMTDAARRRNAQKRGGMVVSLDVRSVESILADPKAPRPDEVFDREWRRSVMETAGGRLESAMKGEGKAVPYRAFRIYLDAQLKDDGMTYEAVADRLGVKVDDVRNYLHLARRRFREEVIRVVRESVASEEDLQSELAELFGS